MIELCSKNRQYFLVHILNANQKIKRATYVGVPLHFYNFESGF
jgi:hypothetical protein